MALWGITIAVLTLVAMLPAFIGSFWWAVVKYATWARLPRAGAHKCRSRGAAEDRTRRGGVAALPHRQFGRAAARLGKLVPQSQKLPSCWK